MFITNTEESWKVGQHWIAIVVDTQRVEIFDSLGVNGKSYELKKSEAFHFALQ